MPLRQSGWILVEGEHIATFGLIDGVVNENQMPGGVAPRPQQAVSAIPSLPTGKVVVSPAASLSYPALRTISGLFRVLGVLSIVASLIAGFAMASDAYHNSEKFVCVLGGLFGAFFSWVLFWGIAEIIHVIIDIETNTRKTACNTMKTGPEEKILPETGKTAG